MKSISIILAALLLSSCAGMRGDTSGGTNATGSAAADRDYYERDDIFHSWIN